VTVVVVQGRILQAYRRVLLANTISSIGDGAYITALPLLAVTVTRDPRLISLVSAAAFVPWLVLSLPAGVLVDRHDRGLLMRRSQLFQGLVVAVSALLVVVHVVDIALLVLLAFLLGSAEVIFSNAAQSVLPDLVPSARLPKANGNLQVSLTVGETFVGPPVGSVLFSLARALPFGLDSLSFFGSAALLVGLPPRRRPTGAHAPMRAQIAEGLRYLGRHRLLRTVAVLAGVAGFANQMGQSTLVLLATQILHTGTRGYGLLWTASAVGAILGGFSAPALTGRLGMLRSVFIALLGSGLAFAGIGLAPDAFTAGALFAVNGYAVSMWNVVAVSLRQQVVPGELLGRVNSVYRMINWGLFPVGAVAGGFVADAFGLRAPYLIGGIVTGVGAVAALPILLAAVHHPASPAALAPASSAPAAAPAAAPIAPPTP
jgi:MFS family permease